MESKSKLEVEWVPIGRVHESPGNPRVNDPAVPHVAASIRRFGWQQPIVARPSGEVVAGNTRLKAARDLGLDQVPVVWFEGSDLEAVAFAIADNSTHEFASWNEPDLARILETLRAEDALEAVGFTDEEIDDLLDQLAADAGGEVDDPGPQEPPQEPVSQEQDLWVLGDHRLLCGDSTRPEPLQRLMVGERARLLATDPPYLVDYQGGNHPQSWHNRPETRDKHWDDYQDPESGLAFFQGFLEVCLAHAEQDVAVYQWHAHRRQALVERAWEGVGLLAHQQIIWVKARPVLTRSHYMWQHEPCFYGWRKGHMPPKGRRPPTNGSTVWQVDQIGQQEGIHPTQKPTELFARPIEFHTRPGDVVLEPFCGSGTQLVAAERLGRRCFAVEIAPGFVDAALLRWKKATGRDAVLEEDGRTFAVVAAERRAR